jgi:hypothetical protein
MRSRTLKRKIATPAKARPKNVRATARTAKMKPRAAKQSAATQRAAPKRARTIDHEAFAALERAVRRLRAARRRLEERLTAAVQEIGTLRHYETRAQILENEVAARDAEIARLREQTKDHLGGASIVSAPAGASN